jgi:hypothetical protein
MIDLSTASAVRTHYGWFDLLAVNAETVTINGEFADYRIPKSTILEVRK